MERGGGLEVMEGGMERGRLWRERRTGRYGGREVIEGREVWREGCMEGGTERGYGGRYGGMGGRKVRMEGGMERGRYGGGQIHK